MDRTDLLMFLVGALVLFLCWCLYRFVELLSGWQVAVAQVQRSGYSDLERLDDFFQPQSIASLRGFNIRDGEDGRWIEDEIVFETAEGERINAIVGRQVRRSWRPSGVFSVWYERNDPQRVTVHGPGYWFQMALLTLAALFSSFHWGGAWARAGLPPHGPGGHPAQQAAHR